MRHLYWLTLVVLGLAVALLGWLAAGGTHATPTLARAPRAPAQGTPTPISTATSVPACGAYWRLVDSPNPGTYTLSYAVAARATNDVWAVGFYVSGTINTLIEHWDGSAWSVVSSPSPGSSFNFLSDVAVLAANDAWAVGDQAGGTTHQTLTEHWDGSSWSVVPSPNQGSGSNYLAAVTAVAANDVWAVGRYNNGTVDQTLIEHWNGAAWSIVASPNAGSAANALYDVTAVAANNVWAVGAAGTQTLVEHWTGSSWSVVASPNVGTTANDLYSVTALAANDLWAVGSDASGGYMQTLVEHWTGAAWSVVASPNGPGDSVLHGVAAAAAGDIWAVGYGGPGSPAWESFAEHWDGSAWAIVPIPGGPLPHNATPWDVAVVTAGDVWSVGDDSATMMEHYSDPCGAGTGTPTRTPGPPTGTAVLPTATRTSGLPTSTAVPPTATRAAGLPTSTAVPPTATRAAGLPTGTPAPPTATPPPAGTLPPTGAATATPSPSASPCAITLTDVHPTDYFYAPVRYLYCRGVVSGYGDNTFRPYNTTTRAQMVKVVVLGFALPLTPPAGGAYTFADVPPGAPFFALIETAAARSLISGYACGGPSEACDAQHRPYFRPNAAITRGQLSKLDTLAAAWPLLTPPGATFTDVPPGSAFYAYVGTAVCHGVISGYADGTFHPGASATRGQIAKIVYLSITGPPGVCVPTPGAPDR